jgi:hypothetical protein
VHIPHESLISSASSWAADRSRTFDVDLVEEALRLRDTHAGASAVEWPSGSAEHLLLVLWPAYGPPPDPEALHHSLDTYWSFLRATGRMSGRSASPADLRKESRRSAPKMLIAYDDPARHSQGRVMQDFGRSVGIDLTTATTRDELEERLRHVQDAWNSLPIAERIRLMPDPSPKGLTQGYQGDRYEEPPVRQAPVGRQLSTDEGAESASCVKQSDFVLDCLRLVAWLGTGKQVTAAGLLRPAVAREAYQYLDLWPWERELDSITRPGWRELTQDPAVDAELAHVALQSWRSAGDCLALDRLWYAVEAARLVEVRTSRAVPRSPTPVTDEEWRRTGLALVIGLAMRVGRDLATPLLHVLDASARNRSLSVSTARAGWRDTLPAQLRSSGILDDYWDERLSRMHHVFGDCGLWVVEGDRLTITPFAIELHDALVTAIEDELVEVD